MDPTLFIPSLKGWRWNQLRRGLLLLGLYCLALSLPSKVLAQVPTSCDNFVATARTTYLDGRLDEAIQLLEACLRHEDLDRQQEQQGFELLGRAYFSKSLETQAKAAIRELLERMPNYAPGAETPPPFREMVEQVRTEMEALQAQQAAKREAERLRALLPPPELVRPPNGATAQPLTSTLGWQSLPEAKSYHVQVAPDPAFETPLVDSSGVQAPALTVALSAHGTKYFWRVRSINAQDDAGAWPDAPFQFSTVEEAFPIPVVNPAAEKPVVKTSGRRRWALIGGGAAVLAGAGVAALVLGEGDGGGGIPVPPGRPGTN